MKKFKLLIIGAEEVFSIEAIYERYIRESGVITRLFPAQSIFYRYFQRSIVNKVLFSLGLSGIYNLINEKLKEEIDKFNPDVIWVFKGMEIFPETLVWAKGRNIQLVNYNPDNPFIFSGKGSGNSNVSGSIGLYDLHFTYNCSVQKKIREEYHIKSALLPFGFDISDAELEQCEQQQEILELCFVGNPDNIRALFIQKLADAGFKINIYGNDWSGYLNSPNVVLNSPVYREKLWMTLYKYRVQLNLLRVHNLDSHNMRTFEVPAIGGIMLAPETQEHHSFFKDGEEVFLFKNIEDCIEKARYLLSIDKGTAMKIRRSARARSINSNYSYKSRAEFALGKIEELL